MSKTTVMWLWLLEQPVNPPLCTDHTDDCSEVKSHARCWVYAPEKGYCPYLRNGPDRGSVHPTPDDVK